MVFKTIKLNEYKIVYLRAFAAQFDLFPPKQSRSTLSTKHFSAFHVCPDLFNKNKNTKDRN